MNPYPGLRPFRPEESRVFAGREVFQQISATRIRLNPLNLLVARSGVGKSSFLNCRLVPHLSEHSSVSYRNEWGQAPPDELVRQELDTSSKPDPVKFEKPVVVLDQFEDIFKMKFDREPLWDVLAELVNVSQPPYHCIISMREEWLGAWSESTDFLPDAYRSVLRLNPLSAEEFTRAVELPAKSEGTVAVEPGLAHQLITDLRRPTAFGLGDGFVEPGALQLVCRRLWDEASASRNKIMSTQLYNSLGGADTIIREFVWRELGTAGSPSSRFTAADRVLWSGMTRHLVVAPGIKSITTAPDLAKKLRTDDLGFTGAAVVQGHCSRADRKYLSSMPENRDIPPPTLVKWIKSVLNKGVDAGFLKRQVGVGTQDNPEEKALFELAHDSLGDVFRQFSVEFETWVRGRWAKFAAVVFVVLCLVPFFIIEWVSRGFKFALLEAVLFVIVIGIYVLFLVLLLVIMEYIFALLGYPILRRLTRGSVPMPVYSTKRTAIGRVLRYLGKRLGFVPM